VTGDSGAWDRVARLDLGRVREIVTREAGWSGERVLEAEREYRRFLFLAATEPERPLVPSPFVDKYWHAHILDTERYAEDCEAALGRFLHHRPARQDEPALADETVTRYTEVFGADAVDGWFGGEPRGSAELKCHSTCRSI
jgi:hypothetical protein